MRLFVYIQSIEETNASANFEPSQFLKCNFEKDN